MSRLAKHPVKLPQGVTAAVSGRKVTVKGKLGELTLALVDGIDVLQKDGGLSFELKNDSDRLTRNMWGTTRALVSSMVKGVSQGYEKKLQLEGVGYRANMQGKKLVLQLGFSHDIEYPVPVGIEIKCPKQTEIEITGFDKHKVGQVAAEIYRMRPPEPYKGKGIRYAGQRVRRKEGKKK